MSPALRAGLSLVWAVMDRQELRDLVRADFAAEPIRTERVTVLIFRLGQYVRGRPWLYVPWRLVDLLWVRMIVGAELPPTAVVGPGLRLRHWGRGVIIHGDARLGAGVTLYHRVTIGILGRGRNEAPTLGDGVYVGTGACILGGIEVGRGARIGANTVVTKDVAPDTTIVGPPNVTRVRGSARS